MPRADRPRGRILVVEDEAYVRESLGELLTSAGFDAVLRESAEQGLAYLARGQVDAVLTDLRLGGAGGLELIRRVRASDRELPVIVLTGHGTIASAVECIKAGASDYVLKPADPALLEVSLERAMNARALKREVDDLRGRNDLPGAVHEPVGESPAWTGTMKRVRAAAASDATVLLLGESGTGKELLARLVHRLGPRADRAYVRVNCAAVPNEMWESEFFGHRRGAFTGATADRDGRFRLAHRGTLFMDEVGTMPPEAQAKILRVLEDGEFQRLGDQQPTRVDVRIVAATNSNLEREVEAGRFREDLYYRLNVVPVHVPPLRERAQDVPPLAEHFIMQLAARLGRPAPRLAERVVRDLTAYPWPGNVRELRNVLERAMILNPSDTLDSLDLPSMEGMSGPAEVPPGAELDLRSRLLASERELLIEALRRSGGVRKEAARLLGLDQRNLPYYLRKHGIDAARYD